MRSIVDTKDGCDDCTYCKGVVVTTVLGSVVGNKNGILVGTVLGSVEPLEVGSFVTVGKGFGMEVGFDIGEDVGIIVGTADVGLLK